MDSPNWFNIFFCQSVYLVHVHDFWCIECFILESRCLNMLVGMTDGALRFCPIWFATGQIYIEIALKRLSWMRSLGCTSQKQALYTNLIVFFPSLSLGLESCYPLSLMWFLWKPDKVQHMKDNLQQDQLEHFSLSKESITQMNRNLVFPWT